MKNSPYDVVRNFEKEIAEYSGSPYAVSVESCSAALFLCCLYKGLQNPRSEVGVPKFTYPSAANSVVNTGHKIKFDDRDWQILGYYELLGLDIIDSAKFLSRNMYSMFRGKMVCLSFHGKKCLRIGRGGMVLCSEPEQVDWLKCARFDGRHECGLMNDKLAMPGWNMYMTPEQAARGLELLQWIPDTNIEKRDEYLDLSKYDFYTR